MLIFTLMVFAAAYPYRSVNIAFNATLGAESMSLPAQSDEFTTPDAAKEYVPMYLNCSCDLRYVREISPPPRMVLYTSDANFTSKSPYINLVRGENVFTNIELPMSLLCNGPPGSQSTCTWLGLLTLSSLPWVPNAGAILTCSACTICNPAKLYCACPGGYPGTSYSCSNDA
eukprot:TRINITY_DN16975_c0_g1_i1.p1 TRINITY_DN16975_c0_g1~~TRINITY_DN16975_c0_g1_i1.p1  ORF type:complete len:193 (+),score=13.75 TRINITY_DN16975_c0_g1_i1:65-580(+)